MDEDELSQRCHGRAMANHQQSVAAEKEARKAACRQAKDHQCDLLRQPHGLPMAGFAP